jgi:transposase
MDNAIIHKTKDFYNYLKEKNMHILYNAPYHSELNPIEYVFSLLKKIISKNISKSKEDIIKSILILKNTITPKTLNNIFNHSLNEMDNFIH